MLFVELSLFQSSLTNSTRRTTTRIQKKKKKTQNQQETGTEGAKITVKVIKLLINKIKRCLIAQHVATLQYIILIANKLQ